MRIIPLTKGHVAPVDDEDYDELSRFNWQVDEWGYAVRYQGLPGGKQTTIRMHRQILNAPRGVEIDHVNRDTLDNRRENLRVATRRQNMANTSKGPRNTSGFKGVSSDRARGTFRATIKGPEKSVFLGRFTTAVAAAKAYDVAALKMFGEFARTNFGHGKRRPA